MSTRVSILYARAEPTAPFRVLETSARSPAFEMRGLDALSREQGEVVYLAEQENVGFVHYERWCRGQLTRRLKYNDDGGWLAADGEPEAWEAGLLFAEAQLNSTLAAYDAESHAEVRAIWQRACVREGDRLPTPVDLAGALRRVWRLPG